MPAQAPQPEPARDRTRVVEARRARLLEKIFVTHRGHLQAVARRNAPSADDAEDALQSACAIFLAKFDEEDQYAVPWLTTTLKREAWMRYRGGQRETVASDDEMAERLFAQRPSPEPGPGERTAIRDDCREVAELLGRLKPNEHKALGLIAAGYSYREIMEMTGWTYTKVNRLIAESRDSLRRLAAEAGGSAADLTRRPQ